MDLRKKPEEIFGPELAERMKSFTMTAGEIRDNWMHSDRKRSDIQRLADLNGCMPEEMEEILEKMCGDVPKKRGRKKTSETGKEAGKKQKEKVGRTVIYAVESRMDEINAQLAELEREIFVMEQKKEEMEKAYRELTDFMDTHEAEMAAPFTVS